MGAVCHIIEETEVQPGEGTCQGSAHVGKFLMISAPIMQKGNFLHQLHF